MVSWKRNPKKPQIESKNDLDSNVSKKFDSNLTELRESLSEDGAKNNEEAMKVKMHQAARAEVDLM